MTRITTILALIYTILFSSVVWTEDVSPHLKQINSSWNALGDASDMENWGVLDYWATTNELMERGGGDCEDKALAKYTALILFGYPQNSLRLWYTVYKTQPHMVLALYVNQSDPFILDSLRDKIELASARTDLNVRYSFDQEWVYNSHGIRVGPASQISHWASWLEKSHISR